MNTRWFYVVKLLICLLLILSVSWQIYPPEHNNVGNGLFTAQDFTNALEAYQLAQVNAPDQWEYYFNAASVLVETERLVSARAALEQALSTDDDTLKTQAFYNLGYVQFQLGRYGDAATAFREVLRHTPDDGDARYNYELALVKQLQEQQTEPEENETNPENTPTSIPADQDELEPSATVSPPATLTPTLTPTPSDTPTPNTEAGDQPPITETPSDGEPNAATETTTPEPNPLSGNHLSLEDVERQLDAIQDSQQTLRQALENAATPERPNEKDW